MDNRYIEVYTANGLLDGETVKIFLESAGLDVLTTQESLGSIYGLTAGPLGEVHLYVLAEQEKDALALLESMERGDFDPGDDATNELDAGIDPPEDESS